MSKVNRDHKGSNRKLRCPECRQSMGYAPHTHTFAEKALLLPNPGDLTQCDHCQVMLEYTGDLASLALQPAPRQRIEAFNKLAREGHRKQSLGELIDYVRKFRQMPMDPPAGYRSTVKSS